MTISVPKLQRIVATLALVMKPQNQTDNDINYANIALNKMYKRYKATLGNFLFSNAASYELSRIMRSPGLQFNFFHKLYF